jgi:hypothetical protein
LLPGSCAGTARPRRIASCRGRRAGSERWQEPPPRPRRELPCVLARTAHPNCRNRFPCLRAGTVRGSCPVPAVAAAGASAGAARPQAVPARSRAAPGSEGRRLLPSSASGGQLLPIIVSFLGHTSNYQLPADSSHDSPRTGCSPFPRPRRWALTLRRHASFEAISRDTLSSQHAGHAARRNRTRGIWSGGWNWWVGREGGWEREGNGGGRVGLGHRFANVVLLFAAAWVRVTG